MVGPDSTLLGDKKVSLDELNVEEPRVVALANAQKLMCLGFVRSVNNEVVWFVVALVVLLVAGKKEHTEGLVLDKVSDAARREVHEQRRLRPSHLFLMLEWKRRYFYAWTT